MYILIGILFAVCILFMLIHLCRRRHIIRKVRCMEFCDKLQLINDLAEPFGFRYCPKQDIMTSRIDAFQKNFGYCSLYDKTALKFNMVFDCEPIYFDYNGRTWMIELWKGQYGINIGAEIGVYHADAVIPPGQYAKELFHAVEETEMLPMSMNLNFKGQQLFSVQYLHWWLTGFRMGSHCTPEDLVLEVSITFPNEEMQDCFVGSLCRMGYHKCELSVCCNTVSFSFSIPHTRQPRLAHRAAAAVSRWQNRMFCSLYQFVTRPFICTMDRILYLYFYLPFAFRHMLLFRKSRKQKKPKKCKRHMRHMRKKCCKGSR